MEARIAEMDAQLDAMLAVRRRRSEGEGARQDDRTVATRLAKLEERIAEMRRARAGNQGPVIAYSDDDGHALDEYVARRERMGAELVVVVWSLTPDPAGGPAPWMQAGPSGHAAVRLTRCS